MKKGFFLLTLFVVTSAFSAEVTVQRTWTDDSRLISINANKGLGDRRLQYLSVGADFDPGESFTMGAHAGYHIYAANAFRPGVVTGILFDDVNTSKRAQVTPYFGFSVQSFCFSFIVSTRGIGGGVNILLERLVHR